MWWHLLPVLLWWCGTAALPSPPSAPAKLKNDGGGVVVGGHSDTAAVAVSPAPWICPEINEPPKVECSCDIPHTLRCMGDKNALHVISLKLQNSNSTVSLLDCTVQDLTVLTGPLLTGVSLHGLVISSGSIREVTKSAFASLANPLQALGLPNNQLVIVPSLALSMLPDLDRLDLSGNKMKTLNSNSFKGLQNLSFIDVSDNLITDISPETFTLLSQLQTLRLRGNKLTLPILPKLGTLMSLEELDLSNNALLGPLLPSTFPKMPALTDLQLGYNGLSNIKKNALKNLPGLKILSLRQNQIDVLEDHAFQNLGGLETLDLSHNRIVAVSGASLSNLVNLKELDLRFNFLRALTADLVVSKLEKLRLDGNEISIVASDALRHSRLTTLTLSDNPLNCDCSLSEFANWLMNSTLSDVDKSSAVCATPPSLENGLLINVTAHELVCEAESIQTPVKDRIHLDSFSYNGAELLLKWKVDRSAAPYSCDAIYVYEEHGPSEVLLESTPLKCNSSTIKNPESLIINVPNIKTLQFGHKYRYCLVLLGGSATDNEDTSIVLGCSDGIILESVNALPRVDDNTNILAITTNLTSHNLLDIGIKLKPSTSKCKIDLSIIDETLITKRLDCSKPFTSYFIKRKVTQICAIITATNTQQNPICVYFNDPSIHQAQSILPIMFTIVFLLFFVAIVSLIICVRKMLLSKPKLTSHQCYLPPQFDEDKQHNKYVKLQATTKL